MGGEVDEYSVSLRFFGDNLDPDRVTEFFGICPTYSCRKGDIFHGKVSDRIEKTGKWLYSLDRCADVILEDIINNLFDRLPSDLDVWRDLSAKFQGDLFCGLWQKGFSGGPYFSPETLGRISERGLYIGLDIYFDYNEDEVEERSQVERAMLSEAIAVNIPSTLTLTVTHEQFVELAQANRELQLERTATGELIVMPPTGGNTGILNSNINGQLWLWNRQNKLGKAFNSSTGFHLPNGADRSPDAAWVSQEKWDALTAEQQEGFVPLCPDFVIELRSKTDSMEKLSAKMREYIENGTRLGWLLDRKNKKVEIYRQDRDVEVLDNPLTLSGEEILPGFVLDLTEVWN